MTDLRDLILNADDRKLEKVHVKDWNCDVYIKRLSGTEQDEFDEANRGKDGKLNFKYARARMLQVALVDKDGKHIFTKDDIAKLSTKAGAVLNYLIDKAAALNNITDADLEGMAKN